MNTKYGHYDIMTVEKQFEIIKTHGLNMIHLISKPSPKLIIECFELCECKEDFEQLKYYCKNNVNLLNLLEIKILCCER